MPLLLHIADLHLGRIFHGESLLEDQHYLLDEIVAVCKKKRPDAVLIAGDIFDRAIPPVEAMALFDQFLLRLSQLNCRVVGIPGNHDSAGRLGYASTAWESLGIHLRADFQRITEAVVVRGKNGEEIDIFAFPFADISSLKAAGSVDSNAGASGDAAGDSDKGQLILAALDNIRAARRPGVAAVLVAHEFLVGASESGSERVYVGGSLSVPSEYFNGFDYVALGHIHSPQKVANEFIWYSGSPMAFSFDEEGKAKGALLIQVGDGNLYPIIDFHELHPLRPLVILSGSLHQLLDTGENKEHSESYVSARVNDGLSHMNLIGRLRDRFPYLREIRQPALEGFLGPYQEPGNSSDVLETPETVFEDFIQRAGWSDENEKTIARRLFSDACTAVSNRDRELSL